jgi:predicted nucleic acid-binding protein
MIGLDCNILVQLAFADHPLNPQTTAKVRAEAAAGQKLVFPPLVATEFLHVVTDARRFAPPLSMRDAISWLNSFMANPAVDLLHQPTRRSRRLWHCLNGTIWGASEFLIRIWPRFFRRTAFANC